MSRPQIKYPQPQKRFVVQNLKPQKKNLVTAILLLAVSWNFSFPVFAENERELTHCLIQARIQYDNSAYEKALEWWNKALGLDPQNKEALKYSKLAREKLARISKTKKEEILTDNGPVTFSMLVSAPPPETPEPRFEKPKSGIISLEDAADLGVKNHLPLQIAKDQLILSSFKEREAFRELFPQVMVRWDESKGVVSSKDYIGRKYQLRLQHPLYRGGELRYTWEQAKVNLKIAQENYDKTKEDYLLELTKSYYDFVKSLRYFDVQEKLLKDLEKDLAMAKKEYDKGVSTLIDFLNAQSQYNQAYYSYLSSENTLSLAKSNFLQLMNLDRDPAIDIKVDTELIFKESSIDLEDCISLAYENRTDLKINELNLKFAELGEKVTDSQQLPKIDLTGTVGKAGEVFTPGKIQLSDDWFVGAKVSMPWGPNTLNYSYTNETIAPTVSVFGPTKDQVNSVRLNILDNLASYTEGKRSQVTREQAYSDLLKSKQTAATQVREAYFNYQETVLKVKNSISNKELYNKELAIMKERRLMNEAQTQDIVGAKIKLAAEETNYISALIENKVAIAKLNKAIGIKGYFK